MKKFLKRLCTIALAAMTCLTVVFMQKPEKASAATSAPSSVYLETTTLSSDGNTNLDNEVIKNTPRSDDNFHFHAGCAINTATYEGAAPLSTLRYYLSLDNEDLISVGDGDTSYIAFTLYRDGETLKPLYRVMLFHAWNMVGMAHSHISGDGETGVISFSNDIHISPAQNVGQEMKNAEGESLGQAVINNPSNFEEWVSVLGGNPMSVSGLATNVFSYVRGFQDYNYTLDFVAMREEGEYTDQPIIFKMFNGEPCLNFDVSVNSYDAQYFVTMDYWYNLNRTSGLFEEGSVKSPTRSIAQVLTSIQEEGTLEEEVGAGNITKAKEILDAVQNKEIVTFEYLEQIAEGVPFAKKVTAEVTVPVLDKTLKKDDVELQLEKTTSCLGAYITSIQYNESRDVYESTYATSMLAYIKTESGHQIDVPLSINLSYMDYAYPFVEEGIIEEDIYTYMWNWLISDYAEALEQYSDRSDEIYGLFGYALVPKGNGVNEIWARLSSNGTLFESTWPMYEAVTTVSTKQYWNLMGEYHQGWVKKVWSVVSGWFSTSSDNAKHVFFYADAWQKAGVISGNGSTDINNVNGLLTNDVAGAAQAIANGIASVIKNLGNSSTVRTAKTLIQVLMYVAAVGIILFLVLKLWPMARNAFSESKSETTSNTSKKRKKKK